MSIKEKIIFYKENLDCFEETIDKYKYLLDQGKKSKPFPEEYRKENFKVSGCQAQVWLVPKFKNNLLDFYSDSDILLTVQVTDESLLSDVSLYYRFSENGPFTIIT